MSDFSEPTGHFDCGIPRDGDNERISLSYGEGGALSRRLIRNRILSRFDNPHLRSLNDAAILDAAAGPIAFTTDSYTVSPLFFPGGDIGLLAVFGTVNDLAVSNALPRWLSLSLIIEEGLAWSTLDRVLDSIQSAAREVVVRIVTGDTKVVPRGAVDGLFINTAGIGELISPSPPGPQSLTSGDALIVSGPIGRHGAAILCAREGFEIDPPPSSDCAPLIDPIAALRQAGLTPRAMRDATRGGLAAVLFEWAEACGCSITIDESRIPVTNDVKAVCELLGLESWRLANEGTFVVATPTDQVDATLQVMRRFEITRDAAVIGQVKPRNRVVVSLIRASGREVPLNETAGAPLPRIC